MKTSIATVSLSGTLRGKLEAAAAAGFDGVELFEPDLVAAPESPEEVRALADRLGLTLDLYQPMRDVEGVSEELFRDVLRRAEAKFALMQRLGMTLVLCCSNVATATIDDDEVSAEQLRRLGDLASRYGIRIAFEALAWGRFIDDYRRAWRVVELAAHPAVGVCLDSFHVLSRGHDPAGVAAIPGDRIFYLQLADAPALTMDVLSWSRHYRLFPGEGAFDLVDFTARVWDAGYRGPLSLEVFNDTFRQTDPGLTARHAQRSLRWLADRVAARVSGGGELPTLTAVAPPSGLDFVEIRAEDTSSVEHLLQQAGFTARGRHRTKPVTLWSAGPARIVLNEQHARGLAPHLSAFGLTVADADAQASRAAELAAPEAYRRTYASESPLAAVTAPDGTEVYWTEAAHGEPRWVTEFEHGDLPGSSPVQGFDHLSLTQSWQVVDESMLFFPAVFSLPSASATEVPGPRGLVQSRVLRTPDGSVQLPLNVAPPIAAGPGLPGGLSQHVAVRVDDLIGFARVARRRGLRPLRIPANYYDDLAARFPLEDALLAALRELDLVYDRDGEGEYLHFYTETLGQVFLEFVERRSGYDGFGAGNAPVRLAVQDAEPAAIASTR